MFAFGDAGFYGSTGGIALNKPIVGMAATPSGNGYWLVASDGGIFCFGDAALLRLHRRASGSTSRSSAWPRHRPATATGSSPPTAASSASATPRFYGSTGGIRLNQPIVGMAATPIGRGYWLVAIDGGIFSFGDAAFYGSASAKSRKDAVVGMAVTPSGNGYWALTVRGAVLPFGDAVRVGAAENADAHDAYIGIATTRSGRGYWLLSIDGQVHPYGDATAFGNAPDGGQRRPVVGIAGEGHGSSGFAASLFSSYIARAHGSAGTWPGPNQVALTFDDGPNPTFTPQILDILDREGVPATFFEVGGAVNQNPALSRRIVESGYSVQNHTFGHETLTHLDRRSIVSNLTRTSDAIERATGVRPTCYRPPSGLTERGVRDAGVSIGLHEVIWNGANGDWTTIGPGNMARNALTGADGRPLVILMHDGGGSAMTRRGDGTDVAGDHRRIPGPRLRVREVVLSRLRAFTAASMLLTSVAFVTTPAPGVRPATVATGSWRPTAASSASATPSSTAPPAACASTNRSSAWPPPRRATGYWLVASDGGIFSFGDAEFYGSTGGIRSTSRSSAWPPHRRATATGSSPPTAASSASATPPSTARPAGSGSTSRSSAWHRRLRATGTGSSPSMAACSRSATRRSTGRTARRESTGRRCRVDTVRTRVLAREYGGHRWCVR